MDAYTMIHGKRGMFENQARSERYNISKALFPCNLAEGSPVSPHVIKMMGYIETLAKLGCEFNDDLATDVILYYHKEGHWFRNCKKYFEEQKNKKESETFASGINVI
jgi:hypothetical protein